MILIRHTKPLIASGLCYGQSDVPYERESFDAWQASEPWPEAFRVYSSPLKRCHDLALKVFSKAICIDARLKELHFGAWENRLWKDLPRDHTELWTNDYLNLSPPGGETLKDLTLRLQSFVQDLPDDGQVPIIVSHAGVIRLLLLAAHGEGLDQMFGREVSFGSVTVLPQRPSASAFDRLLER